MFKLLEWEQVGNKRNLKIRHSRIKIHIIIPIKMHLQKARFCKIGSSCSKAKGSLWFFMLHEPTKKCYVWDVSLEDTNMWLTDPLRCLNSCTQINSEIEVSDEVTPRSNLGCWNHREGDIMAAETCLKLERSSWFTETIMGLYNALVLQ